MLKNLGEKTTAQLVTICQQIYTPGEWPKDFMKTAIAPRRRYMLVNAVTTGQ